MVARSASDKETIPVVRKGPRGTGTPGARPPGPPMLPLIGTTRLFKRDQLAEIYGMVREHGDMLSYNIGPQPIYLVSNPDDVGRVVLTENSKFMKGALTHELSSFMGRGLVTSEGRFWRRQRKIAAPSFTRRHIEKFADTMVACSIDTLAEIGDGPRDVHTDMMDLTLNIVLHTVFGDAEVPDTKAVAPMVGVTLEEFHRVYLTWRRLLPKAANRESMRKLADSKAQLDELFYGIIRQRREDPAGYGDDLLGRLLSARDDDGTGMSDLQVRDEVATIFLAGHETTALALSFAMYLLADHPEIQAKVFDEVDGVLAGRRATMADVAKLPYVEAVIKEAMRVYPPVYMFGREALEDVEIAGWVVPRGAQVLTPVWAIHRDERWYDDPLTFRPERWLDGLAERLPKYAYLPFGGGARVCVGNHFAMLEAILGLATLMQGLELHPMPNFELDLMTSVTLRPRTGVQVRVRRRPQTAAAQP